MNIGILGTGGIARKMAATIKKMDNAVLFAVGSRTKEKAGIFASEFDIPFSYGSYEELAADSRLDLIYIATPHSRHFSDAMTCLRAGRNVLCEKAFTANAQESKRLISFAEEKGLFIGEAMWTRFMPMKFLLDRMISEGTIGEIHSLTANLGYAISHVERLINPELAGGALLDLGVYTINFAVSVLGHNITDIRSSCIKNESGVDLQNSIILTMDGRKTAILHSTCLSVTDRLGVIYGTLGRIEFRNINNCEEIDVIFNDGKRISYPAPPQISGYEYEVEAAVRAVSQGKTECDEMTHSETIFIMKLMDSLRREWGIVFPFEK